MDPVNVPAKFEVRSLPVAEIIGGTLKLLAVPGYAVQGHPRSLILVPIESASATSY